MCSSASCRRATGSGVGIAQAIIHDPPVIILDEPTVGLDPRQINEVRQLIKKPGRKPYHHPLDPHSAGGEYDLRSGVTIIKPGPRCSHRHPPKTSPPAWPEGTSYEVEIKRRTPTRPEHC